YKGDGTAVENGKVAKDGIYKIDGAQKLFNAHGSFEGDLTESSSTTGWIELSNQGSLLRHYYIGYKGDGTDVDNGKLPKDGTHTIQGKQYSFENGFTFDK
ncbi:hypothetical protein V7095_23750, partial [Bacillus thuringiensis]|uniref:hypothetical protein n=1 Tax=Bacillus thuringiensis TaxID=1428 RepID=UPI0030009C1D